MYTKIDKAIVALILAAIVGYAQRQGVEMSPDVQGAMGIVLEWLVPIIGALIVSAGVWTIPNKE